ncbi:phosphatidylserine decarboxylase family protein [Candidatus Riflebacteria bacterium]
MRSPIAREGWPIIIFFTLIALLSRILYKGLGKFFLFLVGFSLYFFRDPERQIPNGKDSVVSPADGTIVDISEGFEGLYIKEDCIKVSIFLSLFDVHINRSPLEGVIEFVKYVPGLFLTAFDPKASFKNEQNIIGIKTENGKILVKQIAGIIARRIIFKKNIGEKVEKGERVGMIRFGSRTDIMLAKSQIKELKVEVGDRVSGGNSILALRML